MLVTREELEQREERDLAVYAMRSCQSRGRVFPAGEHPYRTAYQRDRDRIIHTTAFRRLQYKTQVFVYNEGDHYRNRLTHTIEVAQIGRTLARALSCNEDLIEAICLAHDLGHPPFGHTGETTLDELMQSHGGYDHQKQTYRIITKLERRYPDHPGLNLTYEVREGVVKHDTDYDIVDAGSYNPDEMGTLECQLSNLADEIAYNTSDSDDGLRAGILHPSAFLDLAISRRVLDSLGETATSIDLTQPWTATGSSAGSWGSKSVTRFRLRTQTYALPACRISLSCGLAEKMWPPIRVKLPRKTGNSSAFCLVVSTGITV